MADLAGDDFFDLVDHLQVLTKSADYATREAAFDQLDKLDRLVLAGLLKVGPKGYIHGWIYVGPQAVGARVFHPHHGQGTVTRAGKASVTVRFDKSGAEHAFEHKPRRGRAGDVSGDFAQRVDRRTGKPLGEAIKPEVPKPVEPPKPKLSAAQRRAVSIHTTDVGRTLGNRGRVERYSKLSHREFHALPEEHRTAILDDLRRITGSGDTHTIPGRRTSMGTTIRGAEAPHVGTARSLLRDLSETPEAREASAVAASRRLNRIGEIKDMARRDVEDLHMRTFGRKPAKGQTRLSIARAIANHEDQHGIAEAKPARPVAVPKTPKAPKEPKAPRAPRKPAAVKPRQPGEARRGDLFITQHTDRTYNVNGPNTERTTYHTHLVTSVTRDGKVSAGADLGWDDGSFPRDLRKDRPEKSWIVPGETVDMPAVHEMMRNRTYPNSPVPKPHESLDELKAALKPHTTAGGATPRPMPKPHRQDTEETLARIHAAGNRDAQLAALDRELARDDLRPETRERLQEIKDRNTPKPTPPKPPEPKPPAPPEVAAPSTPKPRARAPRPYKEPQGLEPGATVSWTHYHQNGTASERTGRVWSLAPRPRDNRDAAWVIPDERKDTDPYSAIVVARSSPNRRGKEPAGLESFDSPNTHEGSLAIGAARIAERHRQTGKSVSLNNILLEAAVAWRVDRMFAAA